MGRWKRRKPTTWGVCSTWARWMTICSVEQLPTLEMGLAAWIASGGLVVITDGTVSRQVVSVLVDGLDFRLVVDGWKNPVYLPMVDAYHLEGWKVEHSGSSLYIMPDGVNLF